jgi:hypothetical protein
MQIEVSGKNSVLFYNARMHGGREVTSFRTYNIMKDPEMNRFKKVFFAVFVHGNPYNVGSDIESYRAGQFAQKIKPYYGPTGKPTILLISCLTGNYFAAELSRILRVPVLAPMNDCAIGSNGALLSVAFPGQNTDYRSFPQEWRLCFPNSSYKRFVYWLDGRNIGTVLDAVHEYKTHK